jgi:biphenyl 2,3-dioxygenase beta subunit
MSRTGVHSPGSPVYGEVLQFLHEEAELLDGCKYAEWLALFASDIRYWMPVRTTRFLTDGDGFEEVAFFEENYASLRTRVKRLETETAWAETPPSRTRHYVSNLRVRAAEEADALFAVSSFLVTRTRSDHGHQLFTGERHDTLRRVEGTFTIASRKILIDQTVITNTNLSILF